MIWSWLKHSPRNQGSLPRRRAVLSLETLEARDCPAAPIVSSFQIVPQPGHTATLQGQILDEHPGNVVLNFSGAYSGTATTNASGQFSLTASVPNPGAISLVARDNENLLSSPRVGNLLATPPTITLSVTQKPNHQVQITGHLTDADPAGVPITISGSAWATTTANANGDFSVLVNASQPGNIQATATDWWGLVANIAKTALANTAPTIASFGGSEGPDRMWTFSGSVTDEAPEGLVVQFGGIPSLEGKTATVRADGSFSLTVQLAAGENGTAWAVVTDWWGVQSALAYYLVEQTN